MTTINFKVGQNTVIHASTKKEADKVCKLLHKLGAVWITGKSYLNNTHWEVYGSETCYHPQIGRFWDVDGYLEENYDIITAKEFLKLHNKNIYQRVVILFKRLFKCNNK